MVRRMNRILPLLLAFFAIAAPASAAERRYPVTDFDRVVVEGPYIVRLTTGRPSSAVATGSREALDRIAIDVQGQTLRIRRNRSAWGGTPGAAAGPLTVELSTRTLRSARLIGPASLDVDGAEGLRVDFTVEGSGRLRAANVDADNLSLGLLGSGKLEIAGAARTLRADFQGTGDVDAARLVAEDATISTTTMGAVSLAVERSVTITANGLGDVTILGRPSCTVRGVGAAQVRCSNQR